jgi:hypothetical protein
VKNPTEDIPKLWTLRLVDNCLNSGYCCASWADIINSGVGFVATSAHEHKLTKINTQLDFGVMCRSVSELNTS